MSEERTKSKLLERFRAVEGYPAGTDVEENGIIIYKEDSFKDFNKFLTEALKSSSKKLTGKRGCPDFTIVKKDSNTIIVIECKEDVDKHSTYDGLEEYKNGIGEKEDIAAYAINGALHYASFLNNKYDVVAIGVSGVTEAEIKITSFIYPKKGKLSDIVLLENSHYSDSIMRFDEYESSINEKLDRKKKEKEAVFKELTRFAAACNNFLRNNSISATERAGFISAIVLGLTDKKAQLVKIVEATLKEEPADREDLLKEEAINNLKASLKKILEKVDKVPEEKRVKLQEYYDKILSNELLQPADHSKKFFNFGDNILSTCIYAIYQNITLAVEGHKDLDIMGTFYTVFLKYTKGDAKEKGIVLTPKHIAELFCDIAEVYYGCLLDETMRVLDVCAGTGGFLIAALNRMFDNIDQLDVNKKTKDKKKKIVTESCLYGVEKEPPIFTLAYANMKFHGDGKSNLFSCSSLLKDKASIEGKSLMERMEEIKPQIGMINPPYSLKSDKKKVKDEEDSKIQGKKELDFVISMLEYLQKGGIGIAIVPISCASSSQEKKLRQEILKKHTLLSVMTMPPKLFHDAKVDTQTCIMVFKAKVAHNFNNKVLLARWNDDGFRIIRHNGRIDADDKWSDIKEYWLSMLRNEAAEDSTVWLKRKISNNDEWCVEAYIETDYSKITEVDFEKQLKKYALFQYMQENCLVGDMND